MLRESAREAVRTACLFCGDREAKLSNEHVLSRAIWEHVGSEGPFQARAWRSVSGRPLELQFEYVASVPSFKRRAYCDRCNSGWMATMDQRVSPLVGPMIRGGGKVTLTAAQQVEVAGWVTKVALVIESLRGSRRDVPDEVYRAFGERKGPLPEAPVHLGRYTGRQGHHLFTRRDIRAVRGPGKHVLGIHGVQLTFSVGQFVAQIILPGDVHIWDAISMDGSEVVAIWPPQLRRVEWPPAEPVTDETFARWSTDNDVH